MLKGGTAPKKLLTKYLHIQSPIIAGFWELCTRMTEKKSQESMHYVCNHYVSTAYATLLNPTCKYTRSNLPNLIKPQFSLLTPLVHRLIRSRGQSEPIATNAPVGHSIHWMGCIISFDIRWGFIIVHFFSMPTSILSFLDLFSVVFFWTRPHT
jgi:hypothetical protein